ncbi:hypothetical protein SKAU_G00099840 [Synaphobranchus kaupii]|uniref:Uncharacterized protein n=1 Tax=Synaphobranchus kaupii TaxID=118154 RepID=A0A9Q1FYC5_SYNKA|nr:hypothetical protein SKAU_G00099840 [Synaphobranchus kaupii]
MAPKREPSLKKSPSTGGAPRLGPPFPCLPTVPVPPRPVPELKPRMLRPSDEPFDPSTLELHVMVLAHRQCQFTRWYAGLPVELSVELYYN